MPEVEGGNTDKLFLSYISHPDGGEKRKSKGKRGSVYGRVRRDVEDDNVKEERGVLLIP